MILSNIDRRQFSCRQVEVQKALSSNIYLIWVLQLIARCRQDLLYSSCDTLDLEVAREGVEYEDEIESSPKPLIDYRLAKIQAMSLQDKHAITSYLCLLGYKVTHCGDDLGIEHQLECPLLVDFDPSSPPTPTARKYKWKMFKTSPQMNVTNFATKQYIHSLRSLSVVTNAKTFKNFDHLMTIILKRQAFIEYVTSNMYCLWALELLTLRVPLLPIRTRWCFRVDQYLLASAGIGMSSGMTGQGGRGNGGVGRPNDQEVDEEDHAYDFYSDPLFFSRICKLERMNANSKLMAIPFLRQFCCNLQVYMNDARGLSCEHEKGKQQPLEEYLFSVRNYS